MKEKTNQKTLCVENDEKDFSYIYYIAKFKNFSYIWYVAFNDN